MKDKMTGYLTQAILYVPLRAAGRILGKYGYYRHNTQSNPLSLFIYSFISFLISYFSFIYSYSLLFIFSSGILQFTNKSPTTDYKSFSQEDENIIKYFSGIFGPILLSSGLYSKVNSHSLKESQKDGNKSSSYTESD